jgi:hypothetical protein
VTAIIVLGLFVALVGGLLVLSRQLPTIAERDARDAEKGMVRGDSRTTPLPHPTPVATGWRAWLSRQPVSRQPVATCDCNAASPDVVERSEWVVETAPGVHVSRPALDDWLRARLNAGTDRARLAHQAAREYHCSLRTAQRRITAIDGSTR